MASIVSGNRGACWSDLEMRALIAIWEESDIQVKLDGAVRNKVVYEQISRKRREQGYNRDTDQCRYKVKIVKNNTEN